MFRMACVSHWQIALKSWGSYQLDALQLVEKFVDRKGTLGFTFAPSVLMGSALDNPGIGSLVFATNVLLLKVIRLSGCVLSDKLLPRFSLSFEL